MTHSPTSYFCDLSERSLARSLPHLAHQQQNFTAVRCLKDAHVFKLREIREQRGAIVRVKSATNPIGRDLRICDADRDVVITVEIRDQLAERLVSEHEPA